MIVLAHRITGFLDFFHRPVFLEIETRRFLNWICFRPSPFTWGRKQIQFPKHRVSTPKNTGRWKKSKNPVILYEEKIFGMFTKKSCKHSAC
jgi:hypothetical protein